MSLLLQTPFTMICYGRTSTGKTCFVLNLLKNMDQMMLKEPTKILFCFGSYQPALQILSQENPEIVFLEGIPTKTDIDQISDSGPSLIILDDLMTEANNSTEIQKLFTQYSHHRNISVIFITQNIYFGGKHGKSININSHYIVLFKNPNMLQIRTLGQQLLPYRHKILTEAYEDATEKPYGYLLIDIHPSNDKKLMFRSKIYPEENMIVYLPKII